MVRMPAFLFAAFGFFGIVAVAAAIAGSLVKGGSADAGNTIGFAGFVVAAIVAVIVYRKTPSY